MTNISAVRLAVCTLVLWLTGQALAQSLRDTVRSTYADRIGQPPSEADLPYCEIDSLYREATIAARETNEKKGR
jgi:hypothetical protein